MIKKAISLVAFSVILAALLCSCVQNPSVGQEATPPADSLSPSPVNSDIGSYKDGTYEYTGKPDVEGYHTEGTLVVSGGKIQSMDWRIIDSSGRVFDEKYEEVYAGNDTYIQQCRDNWKGLKEFVPELLDKQDPKGVDAISGATWAYNKFEEAAKSLLEQAMSTE